MEALIDDTGGATDAFTFARKGHFPSTSAAIDFAVRCLGFVWVQAKRDNCIVRLSPPKIDRKAEVGLYFFLKEASPKRVLVCLVDRAGLPQLYPNASDCITGISRIVESHRIPAGFFRSRPIDFSMSKVPARFRDLLDIYQASGSLQRLSQWSSLGSQLQGRFLLVERLRGNSLILRAMGRRYGLYKTWAPRAAGLTIEDQPDLEYGAWLAEGYHVALDRMTALTEEVDAVVYRPGYGRRRLGYRRLVLPFRSQKRELLLSTSVLDPAIDLGIDQVIKTSDVVQ